MKCPSCGFGGSKGKPKTQLDRVAFAIFEAANSELGQCCGKRKEDCRCWTGYRIEAKAAIKALADRKG